MGLNKNMVYSVVFIMFVALILPANGAALKGQSSADNAEDSGGVDTWVIVVSCTFPLGILVGIAWCYCMTAFCDINDYKYQQHKQSRAPLPSGDSDRDIYHDNNDGGSPCSSVLSSPLPSRSSSPIP